MIPDVNDNTSLEDARNISAMLRRKVDKIQNTTIAEEVILGITAFAENYYNGSRKIMGKVIDLTGIESSVRMTLFKKRSVLSECVSRLFGGGGKSNPFVTIGISLGSTIALHTVSRRQIANNDNNSNIASEVNFRKSLSELDDNPE